MLSVTKQGVVHIPPPKAITRAQALAAVADLAGELLYLPAEHDASAALRLIEQYILQGAKCA